MSLCDDQNTIHTKWLFKLQASTVWTEMSTLSLYWLQPAFFCDVFGSDRTLTILVKNRGENTGWKIEWKRKQRLELVGELWTGKGNVMRLEEKESWEQEIGCQIAHWKVVYLTLCFLVNPHSVKIFNRKSHDFVLCVYFRGESNTASPFLICLICTWCPGSW